MNPLLRSPQNYVGRLRYEDKENYQKVPCFSYEKNLEDRFQYDTRAKKGFQIKYLESLGAQRKDDIYSDWVKKRLYNSNYYSTKFS
mmetsp:Transcript_27704/g.26731  ORF Transcript_27704/g.26731 Transcript_27704/m.26731 type:complete len:86 (+) Transcript_27704:653-910(+)